MKAIYLFIITLFLLTSCEYLSLKGSKNEEAVARVRDKYLYKSEIKNLLPKDVSKEDSIAIVKNYINLWAKKQLLLYNSELNLKINKEEYEQLVNEYREDLYINAYKEAVVKQYLDTVVSNTEINKYYELNKESFHLSEELIKLKYIVIGNEIKNPKEFIKLFSSGNKKDFDKMIENEYKLKSYNFNDSTFIKFSDLQQKLPVLKHYESTDEFNSSGIIQKKDTIGTYLIKIRYVLQPHDIAPLNYVSSNIRQMILYNRKQELLKKIEQTLVQDAIKNKQFEEYQQHEK